MLLLATASCSAAAGYGGCVLGGVLPFNGLAWLVFAAAAAIVGLCAAWLLNTLVLSPMRDATAELATVRAQAEALQVELAGRAEQQRRLRHDLRGALSPALLIADRLVAHADPAVKRAGDIMVRTVERATELLAEPNPRADP